MNSAEPFLQEELQELKQLYTQLETSLASFQMSTGLKCPESCGACCLRPSLEVESSLFEMIPLALELHRRGLADRFHSLALEAGPTRRCILYQPQEDQESRGRCGEYSFRPLVCRLFGSSVVADKAGHLKVSASWVMKLANPSMVAEAEARLPGLKEVPRMEDFSRRLSALHPGLATEKLPLNLALAKALEWVGLRLRWSGLPA